MSRTRASAKSAGRKFERDIADYLADKIDDRIDRRRQTGAADKGDIGGLRHLGNRIAIECKNYGGQIKAAQWTNEAHIEMGNDDAVAGVVVAKRVGTQDPGSQWVLMTINDLIGLLTGERPDSDL